MKYTLDMTQSDAAIIAEFSRFDIEGTSLVLDVYDDAGTKAVRLGYVSGSGSQHALALWDTPGSGLGQVQVLARMRTPSSSAPNYPAGLAARASAAGSGDGYLSTASNNVTTRRIYEYTSGSGSSIASSSFASDSYHWCRFEVSGTQVRHKLWTGALEDEPGSYTATVTDGAHSTGQIGLWCRARAANPSAVYVAELYAATDGDEAGPDDGTTKSVSDAGAGATSLGVAANLGIADAGAASDLPAGIAVGLAVGDAGGGGETLSVSVSLSIADAAGGIDALAILQAVLKSVTDLAAGSDLIGNVSAYCVTADLTTAAEAMACGVAVHLAEAATGGELVVVSAEIAAADVGTGADALAILQAALKSVADVAAGIESPIVTVTVQLAELGYGVDAPGALAALLGVTETAGGVDLLARYDTATQLLLVRFALARRAIAWSLSQRATTFALLT